MEDAQRTLVILLSMHRSGSSLTANAFMEQGLSLGPWALSPDHRSNPHGHFEAIPILEVNLAVQTLIHGFRDDLPETEEAVAAFLATEGRWDDWAEQVPEEYVQRGRSLIRTLLDSGKISGFKDPRTVLLWPFWRRVLSAFPGVRGSGRSPTVAARDCHEPLHKVRKRVRLLDLPGCRGGAFPATPGDHRKLESSRAESPVRGPPLL